MKGRDTPKALSTTPNKDRHASMKSTVSMCCEFYSYPEGRREE